MAEITRNRNGHTRCVKCSHFGIFNAVNWPYFKLFLITYHVNGSSRNLTPRNTTRDAFMNKYIRFRELSFRLSRDVSLGQAQQQPQETSTQHPRFVRLYVNAFYFATAVRRVTSPTSMLTGPLSTLPNFNPGKISSAVRLKICPLWPKFFRSRHTICTCKIDRKCV